MNKLTPELQNALLVYNSYSGNGSFNPKCYADLGMQLIDFRQLQQRAIEVLPDVSHIVVAGGDGTFFSVAQIIAETVPSAAISLLPLGTGTENVVACLAGTLGGEKKPLIDKFLSGQLPQQPLEPFEYATPDKEMGFAYWSIAVGGIAIGILKHLQNLRYIRNPLTRRGLATILALMDENKCLITAAKSANGTLISGRHVALVKREFPLWPKFFNITAGCSPVGNDDFLVRFGREEQTAVEAHAALVLDFFAWRILHKSLTDTIYVEPVNVGMLEIEAQNQLIAVDSELHPQEKPGTVVINRRPNKPHPQLLLSCTSKKDY